MKIKKRVAAAAPAVLLAVPALPAAVMAEKKGDKKDLTKVTLNEVAHSSFTRLSMLPLRRAILQTRGWRWSW